jgi:hypothetical protein
VPVEDKPPEQEDKVESVDNTDVSERTFAIPGKDGVVRNLTEQELLMVAQEGIDVFKKKYEENEERKKIEDENRTPDEEVAKLRQEVANLKADRQADKEKTAIKQTLIEEADKYDLAKVGPKTRNLIELSALIGANQNKGQPISTAYANSVAQIKEALEEINQHNEASKSTNNKVVATIAGGQRGGGSVPTVDTSKEFTAKDVRSGKARDALAEILRGRFQEG